MKTHFFDKCKKEDGVIMVLTVLFMVILLCCMGATIDFGGAYAKASSLQTAIDAAALAGAAELPSEAQARATATEYAAKNGIEASKLTLSFENNDKSINVTVKDSIDTAFLKVIHINQIPIVETTQASVTDSSDPIFNYRMVSADPNTTVTLGGKYYITGSIHSNGSIKSSPAKYNSTTKSTITGAASACKTATFNEWTSQTGQIISGASAVTLPDFSDAISKIMPDSYSKECTSSTCYEGKSWTYQTWDTSRKITGNVSISNGITINADTYIDGDLTINGSGLKLNGNLFVTGKIQCNNTATINGSMLAGGNIVINGGSSVVTTDGIAIYSATGNINLNMSDCTMYGIIYAPKGSLSIVGGTDTFYGSLIANKISTSIPATLIIGPPPSNFSFLPSDKTIKLTK